MTRYMVDWEREQYENSWEMGERMTGQDKELINRLKRFATDLRSELVFTAADRIGELIAENKRLGQQCEGLMQAGMNNGQALIIAEHKLTKAMEALTIAKQFLGHTWVEQHVNAVLAELEGKQNE